MLTNLASFEYFCQIHSKSIHTISSYTVSKLGRFFETQCIFRGNSLEVCNDFFSSNRRSAFLIPLTSQRKLNHYSNSEFQSENLLPNYQKKSAHTDNWGTFCTNRLDYLTQWPSCNRIKTIFSAARVSAIERQRN